MTSLTPTLTQPRDDTPATYALAPGQPVYARDVTAHEAEELADLFTDVVWRAQRRQALAVGAMPPTRKGAE